MRNLRILAFLFITAIIVSCGEDSGNDQDIEDVINDGSNGETALDAELKTGIQFDTSTIKVPENFNQTEPGFQLFVIETLLNIQAPLLIVDDNSTVENISLLDDTLYYTRTSGNDCGLPTDIYSQRYQWAFLGFTYTTELGQNEDYNFWITEYKGEEDNETVSFTIFGREKRGDEVGGCMFISSDEESNAKLEWRVSTEGDTILTYTAYDGEDSIITKMTFKKDGSGTSRVTEIDDSTGKTTEDTIYRWTVDGEVSS